MVTAKAGVVSAEDKQMRFWVRGEEGTFKKVCLLVNCHVIFWEYRVVVLTMRIVPSRLPRRSTQGWNEAK